MKQDLRVAKVELAILGGSIGGAFASWRGLGEHRRRGEEKS